MTFCVAFSTNLAVKNFIFAVPVILECQETNQHRNFQVGAALASKPDPQDDCASFQSGWDQTWKNNVQTVMSIGILFGAVIAVFAYDYVYVKVMLVVTTANLAGLSLLTKPIAQLAGPNGIITSRFCIGIYYGVLFPIIQKVADSWFLPSESNLLITICYTGVRASLVFFSLAGTINEAFGWYGLFWITGVMCALSCLAVVVFYSESPSTSGWMGAEEKQALSAGCYSTSTHARLGGFVTRVQVQPKTPWTQVLRSLPVWSCIVASFGAEWAYESEIYYSQKYFHSVLGKENGVASALNTIPSNVSMTFLMLLASYGTNYVALDKKWCSMKTARKISSCLLALSVLYPLVLAITPPSMLTSSFAICAVTLLRGMRGFSYGCYMPNFGQISPTFYTNIVTLSMIISSAPGAIVPQLLIGGDIQRDYDLPFYASVAIMAFCFGFYFFTMDVSVQSFDPTYEAEEGDQRSLQESIKGGGGEMEESEAPPKYVLTRHRYPEGEELEWIRSKQAKRKVWPKVEGATNVVDIIWDKFDHVCSKDKLLEELGKQVAYWKEQKRLKEEQEEKEQESKKKE